VAQYPDTNYINGLLLCANSEAFCLCESRITF